jgi:hypothetical protein
MEARKLTKQVQNKDDDAAIDSTWWWMTMILHRITLTACMETDRLAASPLLCIRIHYMSRSRLGHKTWCNKCNKIGIWTSAPPPKFGYTGDRHHHKNNTERNAVLEKLTVTQLIKIFPTSCVHKSPPLVTIPSQTNPVDKFSPCFPKIQSTVSSHLSLGLPSGLFPSGQSFPTTSSWIHRETLKLCPYNKSRENCAPCDLPISFCIKHNYRNISHN